MQSATEVVTIGAVAVLVILKCFELVRARGHGSSPARVTKETAPEFWLLNKETHDAVSRIEALVRETNREVVDPAVKLHHREHAGKS